MSKQIFETVLAGNKLRVEVGELAKQAGGSALILQSIKPKTKGNNPSSGIGLSS